MNEALQQLPVLVVGQRLVQRAADALRDPAVHLAADDHRVDQRPAVVHHAVPVDGDLAGVRIDLDDRGVHAGGEGGPRRRVVVAGLQARARRPRRPAARSGRPGGRTGWPPARPRRTRSAAGWTAPPPGPSGMQAVGLPFTETTPSMDLQVVGRAFQRVGRHPQRLGLHRAGRQRHRGPGHHRRSGGESADGVTETAGVAGGDPDRLERHAQFVGDDLREHRLVALTLGGQPDRHLDPAVGQHLDVRALVRSRPGSLDVATDPDAEQPALRRRPPCGARSKSSQPIMSLIISSWAG